LGTWRVSGEGDEDEEGLALVDRGSGLLAQVEAPRTRRASEVEAMEGRGSNLVVMWRGFEDGEEAEVEEALVMAPRESHFVARVVKETGRASEVEEALAMAPKESHFVAQVVKETGRASEVEEVLVMVVKGTGKASGAGVEAEAEAVLVV